MSVLSSTIGYVKIAQNLILAQILNFIKKWLRDKPRNCGQFPGCLSVRYSEVLLYLVFIFLNQGVPLGLS